ncbi:MAG: tyrosine-type recombinase/integrase [Acidimicrobiales bacterium]
MALFLASRRHLRPGTLDGDVGAIAHFHRAAGFASPCADRGVRQVLKGHRRQAAPPQPTRPIEDETLSVLLAARQPPDVGTLRDRAALLVGYWGEAPLAQLGALRWDAVEMGGVGVRVHLPPVVANGFRSAAPARSITMRSRTDVDLCPVRGVRELGDAEPTGCTHVFGVSAGNSGVAIVSDPRRIHRNLRAPMYDWTRNNPGRFRLYPFPGAGLDVGDLAEVLDLMDPDRLRRRRDDAMLVCTMLGGLRASEVVALRVGDVHVDADEVLVRIGTGADASGLKLPGQPLGRLLQRWVGAAGLESDHFLFCPIDGAQPRPTRRAHPVVVTRAVRNRVAAAGLADHFSAASLRRGLASSGEQRGATVWELREALRRATLDDTMGAHRESPGSGDPERAVNRLDL